MWTALVPLAPPGARKKRLHACLDAAQRDLLALSMLDHVGGVLAAEPRISRRTLVSAAPVAGWDRIGDEGGGLNHALEVARRSLTRGPLLVIHADLPRLDEQDIAALLDAAEALGAAIAPDRYGTGTNALALAGDPQIEFRFGHGSFAAHRTSLPCAAIVWRRGMAEDLDAPADYEAMQIASAYTNLH
jgi:2-phospho-L-lactate guanylyltransferase